MWQNLHVDILIMELILTFCVFADCLFYHLTAVALSIIALELQPFLNNHVLLFLCNINNNGCHFSQTGGESVL